MNTLRRSSWTWWLPLGFVLLGLHGVAHAQSAPDAGWPNYGNDAGGARYSSAAQINRENVAQLKLAWTYQTGAMNLETELNHKRRSRPHRFLWMEALSEHALRSCDCA